jgi:hypothetical protein
MASKRGKGASADCYTSSRREWVRGGNFLLQILSSCRDNFLIFRTLLVHSSYCADRASVLTAPTMVLWKQILCIHGHSSTRLESVCTAETSGILPTSTRYKNQRAKSISLGNHSKSLKAVICFYLHIQAVRYNVILIYSFRLCSPLIYIPFNCN